MGLGHRWCFGSGCGVLFENSTGCLDGQRVGWLNGLVFWLGGLTGCFLTVFSLGLLAVVAGGSGIFRSGLLRRMLVYRFWLESLILAQDERWRRASHMQVERKGSFGSARVANG